MAITSVESINDPLSKGEISKKLNEISIKLRLAHSQQEKFEVLKEALILNGGDKLRPLLHASIFEYLEEVIVFLANRHRRKNLCTIYNKLLSAHKDNEVIHANQEKNDTEVLLVRLIYYL